MTSPPPLGVEGFPEEGGKGDRGDSVLRCCRGQDSGSLGMWKRKENEGCWGTGAGLTSRGGRRKRSRKKREGKDSGASYRKRKSVIHAPLWIT